MHVGSIRFLVLLLAAVCCHPPFAAGASKLVDPLVESWRQHERPQGLPNLLRNSNTLTTIVIPEARILVASLAKVGSTTLGDLFTTYRANWPGVSPGLKNFLLHGKRGGRPMPINRSNPLKVGWRRAQLQQALADPAWRTATFVRDPVERFVSAFISKCIPGHDNRPLDCIFLPQELLQRWRSNRRARRVVRPDQWPSFNSALQQLAASMRGEGPAVDDLHWAPQTRLCGGLSNNTGLRYYDAVVLYEPATFGQRLEQVLQYVGVEEAERARLLQNIHRKRKKRTAHTTHARQRVCDFIKTQQQLEVLLSFYAEDYREYAYLGMVPPTMASLCVR